MFISWNVFKNKYWLVTIFLLCWLFEWFCFFDFFLLKNALSWFTPFKVPLILYVLFVLWTFIWGISAWRRTLFGKFTRGDRKLWYKSLVSFWIIEVSTIGGLFIAAMWMSWGPKQFIPRFFWVSKKGFVLELIIFSYIVWLLYLLRFTTKWNFWYSHLVLVLCILTITIYLLWRDLSMIYTRALLTKQYGSKWKFVKLQSILYSLDHNWWFSMYMGQKSSLFSWYLPLVKILYLKHSSIFVNKLNLIEYESFIWQGFLNKDLFISNLVPGLKSTVFTYPYFAWNFKPGQTNTVLENSALLLDSNQFLPRRLGFIPKRLAMWTFFVMLKVWHHLMLFIWWFAYLIKVNTLKKISYSFLNMGFFNLYCCFLLGWTIYILQNFAIFEWYLKIRPSHYINFFYQSKHASLVTYFSDLLFNYTYNKADLDKNFYKSFSQILFHKVIT